MSTVLQKVRQIHEGEVQHEMTFHIKRQQTSEYQWREAAAGEGHGSCASLLTRAIGWLLCESE